MVSEDAPEQGESDGISFDVIGAVLVELDAFCVGPDVEIDEVRYHAAGLGIGRHGLEIEDSDKGVGGWAYNQTHGSNEVSVRSYTRRG